MTGPRVETALAEEAAMIAGAAETAEAAAVAAVGAVAAGAAADPAIRTELKKELV